jgi:uncharacterized membrane protein
MLSSTLVMIHVCNAVVGLLSGVLSMLFRKGSGLHRVAGNIFFVSMLSMSGSGVLIAAFLRPNHGNVMAGSLTFYMVATGWRAGRRRDGKADAFDVGALLAVLAVVAAGVMWGFEAAASPGGSKGGYSAAFFVVFCCIALLFAASDVRLLVRGGVSGAHRIARHLWRMCLALLIAGFSFFPGQARLFSPAVLRTMVFYLPHLLLIGAMFYYRFRLRVRKRQPQGSDRPVLQLPKLNAAP